MNAAVRSAELQRCLNSPYLFEDDSMARQLPDELRASDDLYAKAVASFDEGDEATGLKQAWGAMYRAARELGHDLDGAVLASDAFFPFADGPRIALEAGVTALIQPGGSKRDAEVAEAVRDAGAAMVTTGRRHFRH